MICLKAFGRIMIYSLSNRGNSDDLESSSRSFPTASISNVIFRTAGDKISSDSALYGSSAVSELLVLYFIVAQCI